jgi:methyltransferase (TIGR00027 family)
MTEVSHHDTERAGVGKTAFWVAAGRAMESLKTDPLIYDEFSIKIWQQEKGIQEDMEKTLPDFKIASMVDGCAVRTKAIDDEMMEGFKEIDQIVVIGAGLDFRPWRLHHNASTDAERDQLKSKKYFEIDFQEIFDYKLKHIGDSPCFFDYIPIVGNACTDAWDTALVSKGFDPSKKSMWLLEGFTGYLTEEELRKVFSSITSLRQPGSKLIATFLGVNCKTTTSMHRFKTDHPVEFIAEWHWEGQQHNFSQLMPKYGREGASWGDYYLVVAFHRG